MNTDDFIKKLKDMSPEDAANTIGAIMATLGQVHYLRSGPNNKFQMVMFRHCQQYTCTG